VLALATPGVATAGVTKARPLRTGQEQTFGAIGDTTKGVARSYVDLGNGVIKDQKTGLFWEKKSDDGSISDKDNTFTWSSDFSTQADGTVFTVFLSTLNTQPCLGGFCDWRLPTISELLTLIDWGEEATTIDPIFHGGCIAGCESKDCSCTFDGFYWSSTTAQDRGGSAWVVRFAPQISPAVTNDKFRLPCFVRAVRGGTP
jgi:hypothetical protein